MIPAIRSQLEELREEPNRLLFVAILALLLFWILCGCLPGSGLPSEVAEQIERGRIQQGYDPEGWKMADLSGRIFGG